MRSGVGRMLKRRGGWLGGESAATATAPVSAWSRPYGERWGCAQARQRRSAGVPAASRAGGSWVGAAEPRP